MPSTTPSSRQASRLASRLAILACGLALALGGCAAVPLAEMASARMMTPVSEPAACARASGCTTKIAGNTMPDLSRSLGDAFHALTGPAPGTHETAADPSAK